MLLGRVLRVTPGL
jgi:hypothetical protein